MKMWILLAVMLVAHFYLSACSTTDFYPVDETFGDSVRHNIAVQVVNPEGLASGETPAGDGSRSAIAVTRYRTDQVEKPKLLRTADVGEENP